MEVEHEQVAVLLGQVEGAEQPMPQRHQVGEEALGFGRLEVVEVEIGIRPGKQAGAKLGRHVLLAVSVERVRAEAVPPGQRRHANATRQPQFNGNTFSMTADAALWSHGSSGVQKPVAPLTLC
jgi:hypothetical protein